MSQKSSYLVAAVHPWNRAVYEETLAHFPGSWHLAATADDLTVERIEKITPRYLFFLHWPWKVPQEIWSRFECVGFHMTDLPFGRGGSPLQNLILLGLAKTKLSAFQMNGDLDAGPVYGKENLSLEGSAQEIYTRASQATARMIRRIISEEPQPEPQQGAPTIFRRRKPEESAICRPRSLAFLYDFIRMLDADGYPRAFFEEEGFRYEFSSARSEEGAIRAEVLIKPTEERST